MQMKKVLPVLVPSLSQMEWFDKIAPGPGCGAQRGDRERETNAVINVYQVWTEEPEFRKRLREHHSTFSQPRKHINAEGGDSD